MNENLFRTQFDQLETTEKQALMERLAARYRLPLYAMPRLRNPLFCGSLHPGYAGLSAGRRHQEREPGHPAVGPVWNLLFTEKRVKEASTWMW